MNEYTQQVMITSIAENYARIIAKNQDMFVIGFTDGWHDRPCEPLDTLDPMSGRNLAYEMGWTAGHTHAEAWAEAQRLIEEGNQ